MTTIWKFQMYKFFGLSLVVVLGALLDGVNCAVDVDECRRAPCQNGGTCHNGNGTYMCICMNGWNGTDCTINIDDCNGHPCMNGGTCQDKVGSYVCECPRGKTGLRCHLDDACISNPCHSGAVCETSPLDGSYMCSCPPGLNGTDCTVDINECLETALPPCEQGGTCVNTIGSFSCDCRVGLTGARCELNINECASSPCQNDGTCLDRIGEFTCVCMEGFTGVMCETRIDVCASQPCGNGGTCLDKVGYFQCTCQPGYTGTSCETNIQECSSNPCQYGGTCTDRVNGFVCRCPPGTSGDRCQVNNNECSRNNCSNGASCLGGANNFTCICLPGYTGRQCETSVSKCSSNPCQNGATCRDSQDGFRCQCVTGYNGTTCASNIDECSSNPCQNGGSCVDGVNRYECRCPAGYSGSLCESEVNECHSNPCQHGGLCQNQPGRYYCQCLAGYSGLNCEENIDDCSSNPCLNGGQCIDGIKRYTCACPSPYTGTNCSTMISPCSPDLCQNGGQCILDSSSQLGFVCHCPSGFTGESCTSDVDECAIGRNPCVNGATCVNTFGSFRCTCPLGYSGSICDVNIKDCLPNLCQNGGTCVDGLNNYTCSCVPGFSGYNCQYDIDECQSSPCLNGATCRNYVNSYTCTCLPGFTGTNCQTNDNDCTSSSCLNGGTCVDGVNAYSCRCPAGYNGSNCQWQITACDSNPCLNDGTCFPANQSYRCFCTPGWTGQNCNQFVDLCRPTVCQNGGTCTQTGNQFACTCSRGWTGQICDVNNVSCAVAAQNKGLSTSNPCRNGGTCINVGTSHQCVCPIGYDGSYCESKKDFCAEQPCRNGATCSNLNSTYRCSCDAGFSGSNCETNINECLSNPCSNNGTCYDLVNGFFCSCPPGTSGIRCESNQNDCSPNPCKNGGTCKDKVNGYVCLCPPGFTGSTCQGDIDECLSNPCSGTGVLGCVQGAGMYMCVCKPGWTGIDCRSYIDPCSSASPCANGGKCVDLGGPYNFSCNCPAGWTGANCQTASCQNDPCMGRGNCSTANNQFTCSCQPDYVGKTCDQPNANMSVCVLNDCADKANNNKCDPECDAYVCKYDNFECSYLSNIYKNCQAIKDGIPCYAMINDGKCDSACNNEACLFDGWDCKNQTTCNPIYDAYCKSHYGDGHCDNGCNTEECGWDGRDCVDAEHKYATDVLVIIVLVPIDVFYKYSADFLRNLSMLLHGTLVIQKDSLGNDMVYSWPDNSYGASQRRKRSLLYEIGDYILSRVRRQTPSGTKIFAKLDITFCKEQCFPDAELAAEFLAQAMRQGYNPGLPMYSVNSQPDPSPPSSKSPVVPVVVTVIGIIVIVVVLAIVITRIRRKRDRAEGKTWYPEGFCISNAHRASDGQDSSKHVITSSASSDGPGSGADSVTTASESWSDEESSTYQAKVKRPKLEKIDSREWTQIHLEAAGTIPKPAILPFTPPQNDQHEIRDINVRGPGGLTPLMLASMASSEPYGVTFDGQGGMSIITELINDGASIHCKTDHSGETPLHLAARYSRSDAAKRLLDAGADPNAPDNLGRTPLHAAVTADAVGVFQILLRHRSTIVNARMTDGTTPLILAVRLAIEGMVEELINAEADITAADDLGKTSLHWAAAVNNMTAAMLLLRHGANKDDQDEHCQTPLFIAAREGSRDVVHLLLQNAASIDIPDHVDRLPRDIALDRCHHDIVQLLDQYSFNLVNDGIGSAGVGAVMSSYMSQGPKSKQKRPSKKQRHMKDIEFHKIDHCLQFPPHAPAQFVHLPLEGGKKPKRRNVTTCFSVPALSPRGGVRGGMIGNGMEIGGRAMEYPPSYDQSIQGRRQQQCMAQAALPSLGSAFVDSSMPLEALGVYPGNGMMIGGDGVQNHSMAAHGWFEENQNPFLGVREVDMQWHGHNPNLLPKMDTFGGYDDATAYLCQQQQEHLYRDDMENALGVLDSNNFGVFNPDIAAAVGQNYQYDGDPAHVNAYPSLDHGRAHNPKMGQVQNQPGPVGQNFFPGATQLNGPRIFCDNVNIQTPSTYVKSDGQTVAPDNMGKTSSFVDGLPPAAAQQSFLHPGAKSPSDEGTCRQKPIKHVLPLSQYNFPPQHGTQNFPNESCVGAPADSTRPNVVQKQSFPTPPSQHGHLSDTPPQQLPGCISRELYPTPSPDSLGPWSNSPTQSAKSDWSDKIKNSPHRPAGPQSQNMSSLKEEPSFFV